MAARNGQAKTAIEADQKLEKLGRLRNIGGRSGRHPDWLD
jgi:hypothetical protein